METIIRARATVNRRETQAFLNAQKKVLAFVRKYMSDDGWFNNVPVSPEVRRFLDGVLCQRYVQLAASIKDGMNRWSVRGAREQMLEDMTLAMGSAAEGGADLESPEVAGLVTRTLGWLSSAVLLGASLMPAGDVLDACEAITGRAMCNPRGAELETWERVASGVGVVVGSGKLWQMVGSSVAGSQVAATRLAAVASVARRSKQYEDLARAATKRASASEVVLGKYVKGDPTSYDKVAEARKATYFQLEKWDEVKNTVGAENMWNINAAFLRQQLKQRKTFTLTHDPTDELILTGFFEKEVELLTKAGYVPIKEGKLWRMVPK